MEGSLDNYFYNGNAKLTSGDYKGAIDNYDKVLIINPNYGIAYYYRGKAKYSIKDYEGAIEDYNKTMVL